MRTFLLRFIPLLFVFAVLPLLAQDHQTRFEVTESFLKDWAHGPVRAMEVNLDCAGPVHDAANDCELHIGSALVDASISDFQGIVLEPPNLCKDPKANWRSTINALGGEDCTGTGFVRAWPEHLTNGSGCSNPNHFMEVHPLTHLKCGATEFDFTATLRAYDDLGYKPAAIVRKMLGMNVWVCRGCSAGASEMPTIGFDYCFGSPCKAGQASNFARMNVVILRNTIRPEAGKTLPGFATVIARVQPVDVPDEDTQMSLLKLYAIEGTDFYDALLAERGKTGDVPTWEILGIFAIDPFSVLKTVEAKDFENGKWTAVNNPVTLVVFGSLSQ